MPFNIEQMYQCLRNFDFTHLLVEEMDWSPPVSRKLAPIDESYRRREIARIDGVPVLEITAADGNIAAPHIREALYRELSYLFRDSLLIFLNAERTQSIWYWIKRKYGQFYKHEISYTRGQPEDIFLNVLHTIISDIIAFEKPGSDRETTRRRRLTEEYSIALNNQRSQFAEEIHGIKESQDLTLFTTMLFVRLIFLYFLQNRGFLNSDKHYLEEKLRESGKEGNYYQQFLRSLFFEGLALPASVRKEHVRKLLGDVPHLNGPMFRLHAIEIKYPNVHIPDSAFENLFSFFSLHSWHIVDVFTKEDDEVTPNILGNVFEEWFNQQSGVGSSYTPQEITEYLCRQTIHRLLIDRANQQGTDNKRQRFVSLEDLLERADVTICHYLLLEVLPNLSILDPACGSGTFLLSALNTIVLIYTRLISRINTFHDDGLENWLRGIQQQYSNLNYALKIMVLLKNLCGIDISEEAIIIAHLRCYLALLSSVQNADELQPLSDETFHIYTGDSLIGELHENNSWSAQGSPSLECYNELLLTRLRESRMIIGQPSDISIKDIEQLKPLHWCYYFPWTMNKQGGFDIIMTTPPWKLFRSRRTQASISPGTLLYQSMLQYEHQDIRSSINVYRLFIERCYSLLHEHGYCGVIIPESIATDASASRLRRFLLKATQVTGLYCFENNKDLFAGIHPRFGIALLSFVRGQFTNEFPVAFSSGAIEEIDGFPEQHYVYLTTKFLRSFSPDLLLIGRFTSEEDVGICEKALSFPRLGTVPASKWNLRFATGITIGPLSSVSVTETGPGSGLLPAYEGRMIHQFSYLANTPRYWVNKESLTRSERGGYFRSSRSIEPWQASGFHGYHLVYRSIASRSDERTCIATLLPPDTMITDSLHFVASPLEADTLLFLTGIFNSFIADFFTRLRSSLRLSLSAVSHLPVPHLTKQDTFYFPIISRVASLVCTTEDFKDIWENALTSPWAEEKVATTFAQRERLRAELDGLIAHLYTITEGELVHILHTFPLVAEPVKVAVQNAYRDVERGLIV